MKKVGVKLPTYYYLVRSTACALSTKYFAVNMGVLV